jgi:hypothetical protein
LLYLIKNSEKCILTTTVTLFKMLILMYILFFWLNFFYHVQVGTILLSCAFLYDIFWVFVSKWLFKESVMIVVSCGPMMNLHLLMENANLHFFPLPTGGSW